MYARQIILDTETTGLNPETGDRIIEIACIEITNRKSTNQYHVYINAERDSHPEALKVHGLTTTFLADKPKFIEIADSFLQFISGAELIIHNAPFDTKFLNSELALIGKKNLANYCSKIIDTREFSKKLYTNEFLTHALISRKLIEDETLVKETRLQLQNDTNVIAELLKNPKFRIHSLDHLCKYYNISLNSRKTNHGALIDCELLSNVYFKLYDEQKRQLTDKATVATEGFFRTSSSAQETTDNNMISSSHNIHN